MPRYSILDRAQATQGRSSGFDYMRLGLAISVVILHSALTSYGAAADQAVFESPARPLVRMILPMFFALSGYLVAGSLDRTRTLGMFLALRALRIYPALAVEALVSALIIGPLVTTDTWRAYVSDPRFTGYLKTVVGDIHFKLPGVFADNPLPDIVNGQLWTIPFELYGYVTLAAIALLGMRKHRVLCPLAVLAVTAAYLAVTLYRHHGVLIHVSGSINGALLVATFLSGVTIHAYAGRIPWSFPWGAAAMGLSMLLLTFVPFGDFLAPLPAAYATVCLGLANPDKKPLLGMDCSYGVYLYGFAIQQTLVHALPAARIWYVNILISIPVALFVAAASWHFVELPAHALRPALRRLENAYLRLSARLWPPQPASTSLQ